MNQIKRLMMVATVAATLWVPLTSVAQSHAMNMSQEMPLTDGEIRKVDLEAGKLTIKHGPITHMDMPGMTMIFQVKDKALLNKVKAGDKVRFMVVQDNGKMVVTEIQPAS